MTQYAMAIKKRLIDIDKPQKWLIDEVTKETGLYFDSSYMAKIISGVKTTPKIVSAINKVLEISGEES